MERLLVLVEGQTEEAFVKRVLAGHLYACGYHQVTAKILGKPRLRNQRGGIRLLPRFRQNRDRVDDSVPLARAREFLGRCPPDSVGSGTGILDS